MAGEVIGENQALAGVDIISLNDLRVLNVFDGISLRTTWIGRLLVGGGDNLERQINRAIVHIKVRQPVGCGWGRAARPLGVSADVKALHGRAVPPKESGRRLRRLRVNG